MPARKHLFIVTHGRTGSTLLQGILNSHPKIRISGEKAGLPYHLFRCLGSLESYRKHAIPGADTPSNPFFGATEFPFERVTSKIGEIVATFLPAVTPGVEMRGFKEVRHDMPELDNYLDFLNAHFEDSCFVFLTRDHDAMLKSGFHRGANPDFLRRYLTTIDKRFHDYAEKNPERSFELTYEDLLDFDRISPLFAFIGHEISQDAWRTVVGTKHSYGQRSIVEVRADCQFVFFDSAKPLVEAWKIDEVARLKNISSLPLGGVIVPHPATGALESLVLQSPVSRHQATVGLPSLGFGKKFPANPHSAAARFSFADNPLDLTGDVGDFEFVGTFANTGPKVLGRLFVSGLQGQGD